MKHRTRYQGGADGLLVQEGPGEPEPLQQEAEFLGFYGKKITQVLRETELRAVGIDDGRVANTVAFPESYQGKSSLMNGLAAGTKEGLGTMLRSLKWRKGDSE